MITGLNKLTLWPHFKHIHTAAVSWSSSESCGRVLLMFSLFSSCLQSWQLIQSEFPESFFRRVWSVPFLICLQDGPMKRRNKTQYGKVPLGLPRVVIWHEDDDIFFTCQVDVIILPGALVLPPFLSHFHLTWSTIRDEWKSDTAVICSNASCG